MNTATLLVTFVSTCNGQLQFGGSSSTGSSGSSSSGSSGSSSVGNSGSSSIGSSESSSTNTKQSQTDTRFFTGNEAIDGGILGLGAGLLGGALISGALNNGGSGCGRRKRQADGTNTKFLGALLGGSSGCNCGRRRRQAPGEDQPGTRFFGLFGGGANNNNCCNCGYNNNNNNIPSVRCECRYDLVFQDSRGNTHGACRTADETGKRWCYTTGYGCRDARQSQRYPNNPWSYVACPNNGGSRRTGS